MSQYPINCDEIIERLDPELLEILGTVLVSLDQNKARSPWYTIKEAAEYMRCGVTKIRSLIEESRLINDKVFSRSTTVIIPDSFSFSFL